MIEYNFDKIKTNLMSIANKLRKILIITCNFNEADINIVSVPDIYNNYVVWEST